jgi:hypothetical protein
MDVLDRENVSLAAVVSDSARLLLGNLAEAAPSPG